MGTSIALQFQWMDMLAEMKKVSYKLYPNTAWSVEVEKKTLWRELCEFTKMLLPGTAKECLCNLLFWMQCGRKLLLLLLLAIPPVSSDIFLHHMIRTEVWNSFRMFGHAENHILIE
ncbi:hypothetical protein OIU79_006244 [Salix purpurea]|uniref:Uncharacterized protein n=1 Tax=Salix purpurea TaxID=77065 RepID=A0A9Q0TV07_SALPP|nr:hypothetical protein OIU79_006244 [Salix purpurea]